MSSTSFHGVIMSFRSFTPGQCRAALVLVAATATNMFGQQPAVAQQSATDPLNLGFEHAGAISPTSPAKWYAGGQGYIVTLDSVSPQSGTRSLRMQATAARAQGSFGVATASLPG